MLSVIVITRNESAHIAKCLQSVAWADEIVVLDSGSDDDTLAICQQFTDRVYSTDWPGFGPQKQRALQKVSHEWVLSLDADEQVSEALRAEIETVMRTGAYPAYQIPRLSRYCGRQIKHGGWWPDYVVRLFRPEAGRFSDDVVHERVIVDGMLGRLNNPILHESYVNLEEVLAKVNSYSTLGAQKLRERGESSSVAAAVGKAFWTFVRTYFLRLAILDGPQGFMLAVSNAEITYYKYLKLWASGRG